MRNPATMLAAETSYMWRPKSAWRLSSRDLLRLLKYGMSRNNVVIVTGVSSGIGRFIAVLLARQGFHVFGT
jgi:hypothetical protein